MGSFNEKVAAFNKLADRTKTWEELATEWIKEIDAFTKTHSMLQVPSQYELDARDLLEQFKFNMEKMLDG